jgi:hypothetical protein
MSLLLLQVLRMRESIKIELNKCTSLISRAGRDRDGKLLRLSIISCIQDQRKSWMPFYTLRDEEIVSHLFNCA